MAVQQLTAAVQQLTVAVQPPTAAQQRLKAQTPPLEERALEHACLLVLRWAPSLALQRAASCAPATTPRLHAACVHAASQPMVAVGAAR